jgi:hypothetical protein
MGLIQSLSRRDFHADTLPEPVYLSFTKIHISMTDSTTSLQNDSRARIALVALGGIESIFPHF